ncbi:hypothetical protein EMIT0P100_30179 [Pseudomonas sp. IT-P100]
MIAPRAYRDRLLSLLAGKWDFITFELMHRWIYGISAIFWPLPGKATSRAPPNSSVSHRRP